MGLFKKSFIILLLAVSVPLVYRQFANENTIKFMSSYYSNYKVVDQFLRQSAGQLDRAKDYLPATEQVKEFGVKFNKQMLDVIEQIKTKVTSRQDKQPAGEKKEQTTDKKSAEETKIKKSKCPGESKSVRVWTKDELAKFDGSNGETIYLGFLGTVFDVTANMQHYASGAEYHAFAGRDATRAFITGNFTHDLTDDIRDLEESMYTHIEGWASFYSASYPNLGRIIGSFYNSNGCATQELERVFQVFNKLAQEKDNLRKQEANFPDCNSEWNSDLKRGKVWCSKMSGGVERDWIGVPRLYDNGVSPRCACVNLDGPEATEASKHMSLYPNCKPEAIECTLTQ